MEKKPLANRMSPKKLSDIQGQKHILGPNKLLNRMILADRISSLILYGPPGIGKTAIAKVIANVTDVPFKQINAVTSGVKDLKAIIDNTKNQMLNPTQRTILFVDEIHRFNKSQQDVLLPYVEDGTLILIGATTENPYFEVNKALISRSKVFNLKPLSDEDIKTILKNALKDTEYGLGEMNIDIDEHILNIISNYSNGDARVALNTLELASITTSPNKNGVINIDKNVIENCIQKNPSVFDKNEEGHYNTISAFIKSMRGSDPDAVVYYLARMIKAGENPMFIARRIMICASEDVGLANSNALKTAVAAAQAVSMVGMPEGRIILAHAAIEVALSPKSNSAYLAINNALNYTDNNKEHEIPMHLRNAPIAEMKEQGYSIGYKYPHDFPNDYVNQTYLPENIKNTIFYNPKYLGYEKKLNEILNKIKNTEEK